MINYVHEADRNRVAAYLQDGTEIGETTYINRDGVWIANHTYVNPPPIVASTSPRICLTC